MRCLSLNSKIQKISKSNLHWGKFGSQVLRVERAYGWSELATGCADANSMEPDFTRCCICYMHFTYNTSLKIANSSVKILCQRATEEQGNYASEITPVVKTETNEWQILENSKLGPLSKTVLDHTEIVHIHSLWNKIVILWNKFRWTDFFNTENDFVNSHNRRIC